MRQAPLARRTARAAAGTATATARRPARPRHDSMAGAAERRRHRAGRRPPRVSAGTAAHGTVIVARMRIAPDTEESLSDAELSRRYAAGDQSAARALTERHAPRVFALARRMLGETRRGGGRDAGDNAAVVEDRARVGGPTSRRRHLALPGRQQPLHRPHCGAGARSAATRCPRSPTTPAGRVRGPRGTRPRRRPRAAPSQPCPSGSALPSCSGTSRSAPTRRSPRCSTSASRRWRACWRAGAATVAATDTAAGRTGIQRCVTDVYRGPGRTSGGRRDGEDRRMTTGRDDGLDDGLAPFFAAARDEAPGPRADAALGDPRRCRRGSRHPTRSPPRWPIAARGARRARPRRRGSTPLGGWRVATALAACASLGFWVGIRSVPSTAQPVARARDQRPAPTTPRSTRSTEFYDLASAEGGA